MPGIIPPADLTAAGIMELAYAETGTTNATTSDTAVDLPTAPLSIAFATTTRPALIHAYFPQVSNDVALKGGVLYITDAANTVLVSSPIDSPTAAAITAADLWVRVAAGTALTTYKVRFNRRGSGGTFTLGATSTRKPFLQAIQV